MMDRVVTFVLALGGCKQEGLRDRQGPALVADVFAFTRG